MEEKKLPEYEEPKVVTYTNERIFQALGPARTGYTSAVLGGNEMM